MGTRLLLTVRSHQRPPRQRVRFPHAMSTNKYPGEGFEPSVRGFSHVALYMSRITAPFVSPGRNTWPGVPGFHDWPAAKPLCTLLLQHISLLTYCHSLTWPDLNRHFDTVPGVVLPITPQAPSAVIQYNPERAKSSMHHAFNDENGAAFI